MATNDNQYYISLSSSTVPGQEDWQSNLYQASGSGYAIGVGGGGGYTRAMTTFTTTAPLDYSFTTTAAAMDPTQFMTADEKVEYQQQAYIEPRDHAYNPEDNGLVFGMHECKDCFKHNVHRFSADKHLHVIQEEEDVTDWLRRLAS